MFQISNLRKTKVDGMFTFTLVVFLGAKDWLMIPGYRIGKGTIWAPSRKSGNYWPKNVHMSDGVLPELIDVVAEEAARIGITIDKAKALKSLKADPVDLLVVASECIPEAVKDTAKEIIEERRAKKKEKEVPVDLTPRRRILTL